MERLTRRIGGYAHGAEGITQNSLTGKYCRGEFESTACIDKLAEYEDLEEQGKLMKLPVAVGDTYYRIENDGANPPYIREWKARTIEFCVNVRDSIGKTVFLTKEEAEIVLKELLN